MTEVVVVVSGAITANAKKTINDAVAAAVMAVIIVIARSVRILNTRLEVLQVLGLLV